MTNGNGSSVGRDIWKWVAVTLAAFLSGVLISGGGYVLRAPTRDEFDLVRDRQIMVLQRLAAIDAMIEQLNMDHAEFKERASELERLVRDHIITDPSAPR